MAEITPEKTDTPELSRSLEEYLVAIGRLVAENQVARVKDIAAIRGVKPGSVSPAMARLSKLGYIAYERREAIKLTPEGAVLFEKLTRRQLLLKEFFENILSIPSESAQVQAEQVAHCLTEQSTARLEGLIRFIHSNGSEGIFAPSAIESLEITIAEMIPGQNGTVRHIRAQGELSHQLIDMGLLPDAGIQLISGALGITPEFVVALQGYEITLTSEQANAVIVSI